MTEEEVHDLQLFLRKEFSNVKVKVHKIGNGEYVLIARNYFYIWSIQDWIENGDYLVKLPKSARDVHTVRA